MSSGGGTVAGASASSTMQRCESNTVRFDQQCTSCADFSTCILKYLGIHTTRSTHCCSHNVIQHHSVGLQKGRRDGFSQESGSWQFWVQPFSLTAVLWPQTANEPFHFHSFHARLLFKVFLIQFLQIIYRIYSKRCQTFVVLA
eukprot:COSAG03_NODE_928_length_5279_cov_42.043243_5_plen_143_part_00